MGLVEFSLLNRVHNVFVDKNWITRHEHKEVFNRFGTILESFSREEAELLVDLLERYDWVSYDDYNSYLRTMLIDLNRDFLRGIQNLYLFPIIKPEDEDEIKSGHSIVYMLDAILPSIPQYRGIVRHKISKFQELQDLQLPDTGKLLIVDDYIGTGNTLQRTLDRIALNPTLNGRIIVLSIAIQEEAIALLNRVGISVIARILVLKGITDYYESPVREEKSAIMKQIERRLKVPKGMRFGYEESEALITLIRTPNNTFPVFWKSVNRKRIKFVAPFQRN
jgi:hypothetical protein